MEHDHVADGLCEDRLLAESPATPTPSFSLPQRAREPVVDSTPIQFPTTDIQARPSKSSQPTQPQKWALWTLAKFSPRKVTAWVEILQCLTLGYRHNNSGLAPLTPSELSAVHELKDCEEDWLLAWLKAAAPYGQCTSAFTKPQKELTGICSGKTTIINPTDLPLASYC